MYDCVTGVQIPDHYGCIMADEMVRNPSHFFKVSFAVSTYKFTLIFKGSW